MNRSFGLSILVKGLIHKPLIFNGSINSYIFLDKLVVSCCNINEVLKECGKNVLKAFL